MRGPKYRAITLIARKYSLPAAVLVVGIGWYAESVLRQQRAVAAILAAGGQVTYDLNATSGATATLRQPIAVRQGDVHRWLDFFRTPTDARVENCGQGDAICEHLARLPKLRFVKLQGSRVTSAGLAQLAKLQMLEALDCCGTDVSDDGLEHLAKLSHLWQLMLSDTRITDRGMAHLAAAKRLRWLAIERTRVTDAGVKRLQMAVPSCGAVVFSAPGSKRPGAAAELLAAQDEETGPLAEFSSGSVANQARARIYSSVALEER